MNTGFLKKCTKSKTDSQENGLYFQYISLGLSFTFSQMIISGILLDDWNYILYLAHSIYHPCIKIYLNRYLFSISELTFILP